MRKIIAFVTTSNNFAGCQRDSANRCTDRPFYLPRDQHVAVAAANGDVLLGLLDPGTYEEDLVCEK